MSNFFDRFKPKKEKASGGGGGGGSIKWGQLLGQNNNQGGFKGSGETLGGKAPGKVIAVQLNDAGPLGVKVEKRPGSSTAIVAMVVPDSQAAKAGLQRGDTLCFQGSNGTEEILYDMFLELARSNQRPLCFEVRRVQSKAAATNKTGSDASRSAEAYARKQAMIAAAEKRERAHKAREKPMAKGGSNLNKKKEEAARNANNNNDEATAVPQTEEARQAALAAKNQEAKLAAQLGYNPYETNRVTAGQARTATVAATHGEIESDSNKTTTTTTKTSTTTAQAAPGTVRPPVDPTTSGEDAESVAVLEASRRAPPPEFDHAFETTVTSSADHAAVVSSFIILRKLIVNATTKGQNTTGDNNDAEKFRKVRLSNPKIKAAIVDLEGALDIMMSVGFELTEMEDGESYLVYPPHIVGQEWLPTALDKLEQYEKS